MAPSLCDELDRRRMGGLTDAPREHQSCDRRDHRHLRGWIDRRGQSRDPDRAQGLCGDALAERSTSTRPRTNDTADRFETRTEELIEMLSLENGKVKAEARFEVDMVPKKLRFAAA